MSSSFPGSHHPGLFLTPQTNEPSTVGSTTASTPDQAHQFSATHTTTLSTTSADTVITDASQVPRRLQTDSRTTYSSHESSIFDAPSLSPTTTSEDIEMASVNTLGHRRRRSSLMNPPISVPYHYSSRHARGHSIANGTGLGIVADEPKIPEEGDEVGYKARDHKAEDSMSDEDLHDDEETGLTKKDKKRKQRKRRRNTQLDNRIARDRVTPAEQHAADQNMIANMSVNIGLICLWYLFSLNISLYNKWMFDPQKLNFQFPLFTTAVHMMVQFCLSGLVLLVWPSLRPQNSVHVHNANHGAADSTSEKKPIMTKMFYLTRIGPCGTATGLDIGLGNTSLKFITLTFYTMCKSSSLAFVLVFAFIFRLESPTWKLISVIAVMSAGVMMMVAGEVVFHLGGFILVMSAAFFSGFRWALTQILLLRNPATSNPFSSIFFLAPVMFTVLLAIAIPVEGFGPLIEAVRGLSAEWGLMLTPLLILFPGTLAFLMTASEFALLQRTSVVTLSIAGIFKEAVTITAAAFVFGETLTPINISGLFVTLGAIAGYNYIKITKMRDDARAELHKGNMAVATATTAAAAANGDSTDCTSPSGDDITDDEDVSNSEGSGLLRKGSETPERDIMTTSDGDIMPAPRRSIAVGEDRSPVVPHERLD